jgi:hypothetical protein
MMNKAVYMLIAVAVLILAGLYGVKLCAQTISSTVIVTWVTVLSNVVIAGASVAAVQTARKWLPQLTTQEGYKAAITLVNEFLKPSDDWKSLDEAIGAAETAVNGWRNDILSLPNEVPVPEIARIRKHYKALQARVDGIGPRQEWLDTYGLKMAVAYEPSLTEMTVRMGRLSETAERLASALAEYVPLLAKEAYLRNKPEDSRAAELQESLWGCRDEVGRLFKEATEHYAVLKKHHTRIFARKPTIGKLFVVRN